MYIMYTAQRDGWLNYQDVLFCMQYCIMLAILKYQQLQSLVGVFDFIIFGQIGENAFDRITLLFDITHVCNGWKGEDLVQYISLQRVMQTVAPSYKISLDMWMSRVIEWVGVSIDC